MTHLKMFGEVFMDKPSSTIWVLLIALAVFGGAARAQAVTEYDSEISKSTTTANKANHISGEINGIWRSLDRTLKSSQENAGSQEMSSAPTIQRTTNRSVKRRAPRTQTTATSHEDPNGIQPGISYTDLVLRFGRPDFEVTASPGTTTLTYFRKEGNVDLEMQDGRVTKVVTPKPQEAAVSALK